MYRSLLALPAFAAVVYGQVSAIPVTVSASTPAAAACTGCFVVADVAQIIFADYTVTQTATQVVSAGQGLNGSVVTTSLIGGSGQFSFLPQGGGLISGSAVMGTYIPLSGTTFEVGGQVLTSPTAYNIFTQYTEFQFTSNADGSCGTSTLAPVAVSSNNKFPIAAGDPDNGVLSAESAFVNGLPNLSCAVGGAVVTTSVPVPALITTTTSTTTGVFKPTPIGQGGSTGAASTSGPSAITTSTITTGSASGSIVILTPSASHSVVTGVGSAVFVPKFVISPVLAAAAFVLPGLAAVLL